MALNTICMARIQCFRELEGEMLRRRGEGKDRGVLPEVQFVENSFDNWKMPKFQADVESYNMVEDD